MPIPLPPGFWGPPWASPRPRALTELIRDRVLDAELAALLWLLVEARVPIVVAAGPSGVGKSTLLAALLELLPADADVRPVLGPEPDMSWLPDAERLGWTAAGEDGTGRRTPFDLSWLPAEADPSTADEPRLGEPVAPADPARTVLLSPELSGHLPWYASGRLARVLVRATSLGYGLATTIHADRLEDVVAALDAPPVSLTADEIGHLGVVVILRAIEPAPGETIPRRRVVAAHLLRPPSRDVHGHVQRLGPAVLAARDDRRDALEDYAWGVMPEIAHRLDRRPGDLEQARARRAGLLHQLVAAHRLDPASLGEAVRAYREAHGDDPGW